MGIARKMQSWVRRQFSFVVSRYFTVVVHHPQAIKSESNQDKKQPLSFYKAQKNALSKETIRDIRRLRASDPKWTCKELAKKFNIAPFTVTLIAPLSKDRKEDLKSAQIYSLNPTKNWKGPTHYQKVIAMKK